MILKTKIVNAVLLATMAATMISFNALAADSKVGSWPMEVPEIPTKFDWLLTKKGELFAGELISMYQEKVEFDSEEVGIITIDLEDVRQIRTRHVMSIRQENNDIIDLLINL